MSRIEYKNMEKVIQISEEEKMNHIGTKRKRISR
jgi:hypothetical protein